MKSQPDLPNFQHKLLHASWMHRNLHFVPKGPCSYKVYTWALKELRGNPFGPYKYIPYDVMDPLRVMLRRCRLADTPMLAEELPLVSPLLKRRILCGSNDHRSPGTHVVGSSAIDRIHLHGDLMTGTNICSRSLSFKGG